nr:hypothetical protein [Tanacetum cinerariifolium]
MAIKIRKIQKVGGNKTSKAKKLKLSEDDKGKETKKAVRAIKARSSQRDLMNDGRAILITPKMINEMIGIPIGTMAITEVPIATTEFPLIIDWIQMYDYPDERFIIKSGVERLLFEHQNGREFKLKFLVMFFSTIYRGLSETGNGTMKKTRREYKQSQGFGGPLMLMVLLYLNATISEEVVVEEQTPLTKSWDTKKLKLRERGPKMGGFGTLMKNSPAKELEYNQGDIICHIYTPRVDIEDGVFGIAEGSNRIEAIRQFQKKKAEDTEIDINRTLAFTECVQKKVDEMLMKAFKPGKIVVVLELENVIETGEHLNHEQDPDEDNIHSTNSSDHNQT